MPEIPATSSCAFTTYCGVREVAFATSFAHIKAALMPTASDLLLKIALLTFNLGGVKGTQTLYLAVHH